MIQCPLEKPDQIIGMDSGLGVNDVIHFYVHIHRQKQGQRHRGHTNDVGRQLIVGKGYCKGGGMECNIIHKECMTSLRTSVTESGRRRSLCDVLSAFVSEL